jgi:hypothetical protein
METTKKDQWWRPTSRQFNGCIQAAQIALLLDSTCCPIWWQNISQTLNNRHLLFSICCTFLCKKSNMDSMCTIYFPSILSFTNLWNGGENYSSATWKYAWEFIHFMLMSEDSWQHAISNPMTRKCKDDSAYTNRKVKGARKHIFTLRYAQIKQQLVQENVLNSIILWWNPKQSVVKIVLSLFHLYI